MDSNATSSSSGRSGSLVEAEKDDDDPILSASVRKQANCGQKGVDTGRVGIAEPGEWAWHVILSFL